MSATIIPFKRPACRLVAQSGTEGSAHPRQASHRLVHRGASYHLTHYPDTVALVTPQTEWWLSPSQARELARTLFRFANYAEQGKP